jgi:hypothetical protein
MKPSADGVVAEISADGVSWSQFGMHAVLPATPIPIALHAGQEMATNVGKAVYNRWIICK